MAINIIGSCVTRDVFECVKNNFKLKNYFARTSFISLMSPPLNVTETQLSLNSNFQKQSVLADLNKNIWDKLSIASSEDYIIIDLIDERFNLYQINDTYFTRSNELVSSGFLESLSEVNELNRLSDEVTTLWYEKTKNFFDKLLTIYTEDKVIIHKTKWQTQYLDKFRNIKTFQELKGINNKNIMLEKYYAFIQAAYPSILFIDMTQDEYLSDENHTWGLAPYHFEKKYYLDFISRLKEITNVWAANYYLENTNLGQVNIIAEYDARKSYLDLGTTSNVRNTKNLKFDSLGIPQLKVGNNGQYGYQYYPITIGVYGLELISKYYTYKKDQDLNAFLNLVDFLVETQDENGGWANKFDYFYGVKESGVCKAPWYSALAQGFCISNLCRAYVVAGEAKYLNTALKALKPFERDVLEGGVKRQVFGELTFYEEYPTEKPTHILNGFIFSLLGLYDLYDLSKNEDAYRLYKDGLKTLETLITAYDLGNISSYDLSHITIPGNPAKYHYGYHLTHVKLLSALYDIEKNPLFKKVQDRWLSYAKGNKSFYKLDHKFIEVTINDDKELIFNNLNQIVMSYNDSGNYEYAAYIYKNDEKIFVKQYDDLNKVEFKLPDNNHDDHYKLIVFVRDEFNNTISKTYDIEVELEKYNFLEAIDEVKANTKISIVDGVFLLDLPNINRVEFAYYLSNSNGILEKKWYTRENSYSYNLDHKDNYKCVVFIKRGSKQNHFEISFDY